MSRPEPRVWTFVYPILLTTAIAGCGGDMVSPRASQRPHLTAWGPVTTPDTYGPISADYYFGSVRVTLDSANGRMMVWEAGNGYSARYAFLTAEQIGVVSDVLKSAQLGDRNYNATNDINPDYNRPPTWQTSLGGDSEGVSRRGRKGNQVLIRRARSTAPRASAAGTGLSATPPNRIDRRVPSATGEDRPMWDGPMCYDISQGIAAARLNYWNQQGDVKSVFERMARIPQAELDWGPHGEPIIKPEKLQTYLFDVGQKAAEFAVRSTALNFHRVMYNSWDCQNVITIQVPNGNAFVSGWARDNGGGGATRHYTCESRNEMWEISYDGGRTWSPFRVMRTVCQFDVY